MPEPTGSTSVARAAVRLPIRSDPFQSIIGRSPCMLSLFELMEKMLQYDLSVVIKGESGTGKELVAGALHQNGLRRFGPLVIVNCATLGGDLLQSTLFGHVRGSFTGASTPRKGLFEQADRGTIFLDELGEMDLGCQAMLLRVLQEGTFTPVGGNDEKQVDVRIIAATNRDLGAMVNAGTFRRDLFERLNTLSLRVPPLRERVDDIPLIVDHLLDRIASSCQRSRKSIAQNAMAALQNRKWSGNIRELENVLIKAWVDSDPGNIIQIEHIPLEEQHGVSSEAGGVQRALKARQTLAEYLADFERRYIKAALEYNQGVVIKAARALGINRGTLKKRLKNFEIPTRET